MGEQPLAVDVGEPGSASTRSLVRRMRSAGAAVVAAAAIGTGLVLWIESWHMVEPVVLFGAFPWLYGLIFLAGSYDAFGLLPLVFGIALAVLGVAVIRGSRGALVSAITLLAVEAVPTVIIAAISGGTWMTIPALPRAGLLIYLASALRKVEAPSTMSTGSYSGPSSAGAGHTRAGVVRGVVAWTCAVAVAVALALISRGAEAFLVTPGTNDDDAAALLQWWYRLAWPPALLAFGFGWFAESRWTAFVRGAVVAALVSSLQTVGWYVGTVERLTDVLTAAVLGGAMGWLGHQGRGRTLLSVLAALCLPGVMALEVIRPHGGMHPESLGVWVVVCAAALLAALLVLRPMVLRARDRRGATAPAGGANPG